MILDSMSLAISFSLVKKVQALPQSQTSVNYRPVCGYELSPTHPYPLSSATLGKLLTHMPLSPSSIISYQPMGGDALRLGR